MTFHPSSSMTQAQTHFRPKPDGARDPAGEAGWYLQREREMRGLSLDKAGQDTGIHPHHLEAIEKGNLEGLPERSQALQMIGAYARYLGFDPRPLVAHFSRLMPRPVKPGGKLRAFSSAKVISFPLIERLRSMTSGAGGVVASVMAAVLLFGGTVWVITADHGASDGKWVNVAAAPEGGQERKAAMGGPKKKGVRTVSSISQLAEQALGDDKPLEHVNSMEELIKRTATGDISSPAGKPKDAPVASREAGSMAAPPAQAGKTAKAAAPGRGFVLRAVDDIWVRIEDKDGNSVYSGMLKKGETYTVPPVKGLTIIARDGGLLEWMEKGKVMGRLTKPGTVLVGEPLSPQALRKRQG